MKVKVTDSLDNVSNENVVTQLVTDLPTNRQTDQLLELLEWLFATKNRELYHKLKGTQATLSSQSLIS